MNQVRTLRSVIDAGLNGFAGLFVPGGHAPAVDLMQDADLGAILQHFHKAGRPTAMRCHGPVATAAAMPLAREFRPALIAVDKAATSALAEGWIYAGYRMTVFSAGRGASGRRQPPESHVVFRHARSGTGGAPISRAALIRP